MQTNTVPDGKMAIGTDDTDQTVLLMEAIVAGKGVLDQARFASALKSWVENGFPELGDKAGLGVGNTVSRVLIFAHPFVF